MWLSNLFATRRELKRLLKSEQFWRERAQALEKELKKTNDERYERELRLVDRINVSKGVFAITDEVRHTVESRDEETLERKEREELNSYLENRKRELIEDARDAGRPVSDAEILYQQLEPSYVESFQQASKFE